jgi:aspartyl/asparaginyl beta-hydroxylase (cupin superfamily)
MIPTSSATNAWFHDSAAFPFVTAMEQHWQAIYEEFQGIRELLIPWHERKLCDQGWQVFALFGFPDGKPIADHVERCPKTAALIEQQIPTHGAAGFSLLAPRTRIHPHQGFQAEFLRCHLGLSVPEGDCALRIETESRPWQTGRAMVFDDRFWHEAWNLTDEERVVLLIDFVP